jgi:hypothetical protein
MKKQIVIYAVIIVFAGFLISSTNPPKQRVAGDEYILLAWNDLGMHCANQDFSKIAVLPPYNNLISHVIRKGTETTLPEVVTADILIEYEIPGNTYSIDKTNFWDYEDQLFGVNLPDNIGLTGAGLAGEMEVWGNAFTVEGIPITPYTDNNLNDEDPFQLALVTAYSAGGNLIAETQNVIPVSNEISCVSSGCHSSENNILMEHDDEGGFDPNNTPILCASCHASNALGTTGIPEANSLSEVIHDKHKEYTNDCYKCHPGQNAQCQRGVMHAAGMVCQDCHGDVEDVAESIKDGREPWLDEPKCGAIACHGPQYAEEPGKLYRLSKGHGGLYCSACHGSPHALVPSTQERDNVQNIALQGYSGVLNNCAVCHGYMPSGPGPHGLSAPSVTTHQIELSTGWNGLSSYLFPVEQNMDDIFADIIDQVIIIQSSSGVFWPDQQINTLGYWSPEIGYAIKVNDNVMLEFNGIVEAAKQLPLETGWSIMPVLSSCDLLVSEFVAQNPEQVVIIKDMAGSGVYWPYFGINTLNTLETGKSYYILNTGDADFIFPDCNEK